MGGRKFCLSTRKNEERKTRQKRALEQRRASCAQKSSFQADTYMLSLPISAYLEGTTLSVAHLFSRLMTGSCIPPTWIVARQSHLPLLLCKLNAQGETASLSPESKRCTTNTDSCLDNTTDSDKRSLLLPTRPMLL